MMDRNEPLDQIKTRRDSALRALATGVPYMTWLGIRFDRRGDELTAIRQPLVDIKNRCGYAFADAGDPDMPE